MRLLASLVAVCLVGVCSAGLQSGQPTPPPSSNYGQSHGQTYHGGGVQQHQQGAGLIGHAGQGQNVVTPPAPSRYLGCFRDQRTPRTLPLSKIILKTTNSPLQCIHACAGFKYAGVESKEECFCGNDQPAKTLPQSDCHDHCPGDRSKTCGGNWAMDVHTVPHSPRPNIDYKGCFKDKRERVLPGSYGVIEHTLTPYQCANMCYGYKFAGVEQGKDCHCGNTLPHETVPEAQCNAKCTGDQSKTCGGNWAIAVYEIYQSATPYG